MSVVSWSPELRNVVRDIKKFSFRNKESAVDFSMLSASGLSVKELQAVKKSFSKPMKNVAADGYWF